MTQVAKKNKRHLKAHNLETATKVAVIMCYQFDVENNALTRLRNTAEKYQLDMTLVIYYPQKSLPENIQSTTDKIVFSNKETNWLAKPQFKLLDTFLNEPFDLLINLATQNHFPLEYITASSNAAFKVGRIDYSFSQVDFLLLSKEGDNDEGFILNLEKYLSNFK